MSARHSASRKLQTRTIEDFAGVWNRLFVCWGEEQAVRPETGVTVTYDDRRQMAGRAEEGRFTWNRGSSPCLWQVKFEILLDA